MTAAPATICGLETEYGLMVEARGAAAAGGAFGQEEAALALLRHCPLSVRVPWDPTAESPARDARAARDARDALAAAQRDGVASRQVEVAEVEVAEGGAAAAACHAGFLLANGARLYVDCGHPEYSTPECADPLALLCADRAGELVLDACRCTLSRFLPPGHSIRLIKNNGDGQGHSYACHENYLVTARLHAAIWSRRPAPLLSQLVPFLVSRIVIAGAGKAGSDNGRPPAAFQISQRADFVEELVGLQTMSRRPLINSRDEPHCDGSRGRRLHVIPGDSNMAQTSTWLKVGSLQLLLAMLEAGAAVPDLTLDEPLAALFAISRDATCRQRVAVAGARRWTAVEIQLAFVEAAQRFTVSGAAPPWAAPFVERWHGVLRRLAEEPRQLAGTLDWAIKLDLLERWRTRKRLPWSAEELRELDIRYHDVDRDRGVFYQLERGGAVERIAAEDGIRRALEEPPSPTRAATRAALLRRFGDEVVAGSWGALTIREDGGPLRRIEIADPARGPAVEVLADPRRGAAAPGKAAHREPPR